jgi:NTP pyrophosphatase (non-canonical NTP hydrolase)
MKTFDEIMNTDAMESVIEERVRQEKKWGQQDNDPFVYLTVLGEEFGELCQAALHTRFGGKAADKLREEAVHTAAVALAIVECLDRGLWSWGDPNVSGG